MNSKQNLSGLKRRRQLLFYLLNSRAIGGPPKCFAGLRNRHEVGDGVLRI